MKITIKTKNLELTPSLKKIIEEEINSLEKFSKIFYSGEYFNHFFGKGKPRVETWLEIGRETQHHKKGLYFWAECQMKFPGKGLRATTKRESFKAAITEIKEELQRQIKQYKEKIIAKEKRGARVFKKELRVSPRARFYRKGRIREEGI